MLDVILAYAHHLAVFSLVGLIFAEFVLLTPGISGPRLLLLGAVDAAYGGMAILVVVAGVLRVYLGASGADYYFGNHVFWTKMALFIAAGFCRSPPPSPSCAGAAPPGPTRGSRCRTAR
jgi:putative membrane protein